MFRTINRIVVVVVMIALISQGAFQKEVAAANGKAPMFSDISKHWAKEQIEQATLKGYINGFPGGKFKPDAPVTRAQFIKMIVTALDLDYQPEGSVWYTTYVTAAKEAGIYQGNDFAEWNMNKEINREHMAWLAVRAADNKLTTVESSGITKEVVIDRWPYTANDNKITRTDEFMRNYYEGFLVHTAFSRGILQGYGGNVIGLDRTTTRAQAVTVIERILNLREGKKLTQDKYATAEAELLWLKTNSFTMAKHIFDDPKGSSMKTLYKLENLEFKNNIIHTEVKRIILIDLDDPKDPYRKLLPATKKLGFRDGNIGKVPSDAYAMYIEYETYYNKNPKQYIGGISLSVTGYERPNPYPFDKLVEPNPLITNEKGFEHISSWGPYNSSNGVGKGVEVWVIPNSGYTLEPNIGSSKNNVDRRLLFSFYTIAAYGGDNTMIRNHMFGGTTTHYGK